MGTRTVTSAQREYREHFGRRLKELRLQRGLNQEELAWRMQDIDRRMLIRLEKGRAPVELHRVREAAVALQCEVALLISFLLSKEEMDAEASRQATQKALYRDVAKLLSATSALQGRIEAVATGSWHGHNPAFISTSTVPFATPQRRRPRSKQ